MRRETVRANGLDFSCLVDGPEDAPMLLMLHGFPEYSGAWAEMIERLSDSFLCVAPDQRGYNLSSKPADTHAYAPGKLVSDALAILDHYRPGQPARAVIGHDWGASVAYALAIRAPQRMERLVIANGVHPVPFQRALARGGAQTEASQYIRFLREPDAHEKLAADDFSGLMRMLQVKMDMSWMTPGRLEDYKQAWRQPGAIKGMVDWYRATPLVVPPAGESADPSELPDLPADQMRIRMPHLLIWGMEDGALLPEAREGLDALCDDLRLVELEDCDHWLIHQKPDEIAALIRDFVS
ncbi:MAG: alpha/beta fold hydrolase [Pseudomonadota bacterium]